jgi:hypothetical protein
MGFGLRCCEAPALERDAGLRPFDFAQGSLWLGQPRWLFYMDRFFSKLANYV